MHKMKLLASCSLSLVLAGCAATAQQPPAAAAATAAPAAAWPQQASDLQADPNVRFGLLPNGMRYAIMKNATPPGEASLRLRIDAGSLNERDDQRGLAHFLEHMVLNGTKNVPEGEFVRRLERHGLKFGPDTNASTDFQQTVYMLDLPETDAETIDTALFLLREVADEATLDPAAIDSERGIILSEERTRATPQYRTAIDELAYLLKDDLLPRRLPIGDTETIRTAPRDRFVDFYNAYYRPERATMIAVGDFDVAEMEAKIRNQFGSWQGEGTPGAELPEARIGKRETETRVFVEPGVPTRVSLGWIGSADESPDTKEHRKARLIEMLGLQIISRRMERIASAGANAPFIGGAAYRANHGGRGEVTQIVAVAQEGKWQPALASIEQEQRRVMEHGFTQAELDREVTEIRARLVAAATGAATRPSASLAQGLVGAVNEDDVFTAPAADLALFDESVRGLTASQVTAATRRLLGEGGPLLYLTSPAPVETGEQALIAAYNESRLTPVKAPEEQQAKAWPYQSFGTPGTVAERSEVAGLDVTNVRFQNGVRLTVKPTKFKDDEILVSVRFGAGQLELSPKEPSPVWAIASGGFIGGGPGKISFEDLQEVLASKVYGANAGIAEDAFLLQGRTRPEDMALQMQLLAAYVADPGWRETAWDRLRAFSGTIHDQLASTPSGVFSRDGDALLHSGDQRWGMPSRAQMESATIAEGRKLLDPALKSGPIEVVIVGDISVDEAIRQTAATFGALPQRQAAPTPTAASRQVRFPAPGIERRTHNGRADQGLAFIAWPTTDFYSDQKRTRALNLLAQVMQLRLTEEIREKQGTTYSPNASHSPSEVFEGYGYIAARIEAPPASLDTFFNDALAIARDLRDRPVSADELQRARRPLVENIQRQRAGNEWWLSQLGGAQERPAALESIRVSLDQYNALTPADLQQAARDYLAEAKAWRMIVTPEKS